MNNQKKVLLYLGKFPGYGFDIDGGSIMARQLIDTLKHHCCLDVVFIRKNQETFEDDSVNNVCYVEYLDPWNNKFIRRMKNLGTNALAMSNNSDYDVIIAAHISKFFGLDKMDSGFWKKTILFPMFCSTSYIRAGEIVPKDYINEENIVVKKVGKIITPSLDEKKDLIIDYGCKPDKIKLIYRGITPLIKYKKREINSKILKIICIGTLKLQKNTKETLNLLELLDKNKVTSELHLVCTIQEQKYYEDFIRMIDERNYANRIHFHISIKQSELAELIDTMNLNISMSKWETFGRGIFEGVSAGLPTFVFDELSTVKDLCEKNYGICFCKNTNDMADKIITCINNKDDYKLMSASLEKLSKKFSFYTEQKLLRQEILNYEE